MRDIQKYTSDYECMDDPANRFETEYQVVYRRKKVLEELKRYQHDTILEVGCGLDSYVNYITEFKRLWLWNRVLNLQKRQKMILIKMRELLSFAVLLRRQ